MDQSSRKYHLFHIHRFYELSICFTVIRKVSLPKFYLCDRDMLVWLSMMVLYAAPNFPTVFQILDSENSWDDFLLSEIASLSLLYNLHVTKILCQSNYSVKRHNLWLLYLTIYKARRYIYIYMSIAESTV